MISPKYREGNLNMKNLAVVLLVVIVFSASVASTTLDPFVCRHGIPSETGNFTRIKIVYSMYGYSDIKCRWDSPSGIGCNVLSLVKKVCEKKKTCEITTAQIPPPAECESKWTYLYYWFEIHDICPTSTKKYDNTFLTFIESWENETVNSVEVFDGTGIPKASATCTRPNGGGKLYFVVNKPSYETLTEEPNPFKELPNMVSNDPDAAVELIGELSNESNSEEVTPKRMEFAISSVDQILTLNKTIKANSKKKELNKAILQLLDSYALNLVLPQKTSVFNVAKTNLAITVKDFNDSDKNASSIRRTQMEHSVNGTTNFKVSLDSNFTNINDSEKGRKIRMAVYSYETQELLNTQANISEVASVHVSIAGKKVEGYIENITIKFESKHAYEPREKLDNVLQEKLVKSACVQYVEGEWKQEGCTIGTSGKHPICKCNPSVHATHRFYSILVNSKKVHAEVELGYLSIIGCIFSIVGLFVTIVIHLYHRDLRQRKPTLALVNICSCLMISMIIFISNIGEIKHLEICYLMTALLHYLLLCTWTWMSINAVKMYVAMVKVISTRKRRIRSLFVIGYGFPSLVVVTDITVSYIVDLNKDKDDIFFESSYRSRNMCWLSSYSQYYGFLLPIAMMLFINIVSFVNIILSLKHRLQSNQTKRRKTRSQLLNAVYMSSVMGLTWIIGYLMLIEEEIYLFSVFSWIFCIFNSTQGVTIFLLSCVRNENVRVIWLKPLLQFFRNMIPKRMRDPFFIELSATLQKRSEGNYQLRRNTESTAVPVRFCE